MVYTDFCVTIKPDLESIDSIRETVMAEYIGPESRFSGEHYPHQYTTRTEDNHFYFGRRDQHGRPVDWGETLREDGMGDGIIAVVFAVETDHIGYGQLHQYDDQTGTYEPVPEIADGPGHGEIYEGEHGKFGTDVVEAFSHLRDFEPAYYRSGIYRPSDDPFLPRAMRE